MSRLIWLTFFYFLNYCRSSANAKKWEVELATLKNNNARLTSALQESTANVEEWKRQLQAYKDENQRVKSKIVELEAGRGPPVTAEGGNELKREVATLRLKIDSLENELRAKDDEIRRISNEMREMNLAGDRLKVNHHFYIFLETFKSFSFMELRRGVPRHLSPIISSYFFKSEKEMEVL